MIKGDPKVGFDWKVEERGKCIPVKLRVCWIMKHKGSQTPVLLHHFTSLGVFSSDLLLQESESRSCVLP